MTDGPSVYVFAPDLIDTHRDFIAPEGPTGKIIVWILVRGHGEPYDPERSPSIPAEFQTVPVPYNRFGQGKFFVKVNDIRRFHAEPIVLTVPHPATEAVVALQADIIAACADGGMWEEDNGMKIRWTPECAEKLNSLYDRWCKVLFDFAPLSDEHFRDNRHSSGQENEIHGEQRGGLSRGYGPYLFPEPRDYHYTVEIVERGGDLIHTACGAHIKLHQHFLDKAKGDLTFYGRIRCPSCGHMCPREQFSLA